MENFFTGIYYFFEKRRWLLFVCFAATLLLAANFARQVTFEEDISKILPHDKKVEKLNQVFQNSKFIDKLVITVSMKDSNAVQPDSLVAYADSLATALLNTRASYISKLSYKVDGETTLQLFQTIQEHLPVYLGEKDYATIDSLIEPARVRSTLEQNVRTLSSPAGFALKNMIANDPVGLSFIGLKKLQQLQYDESFELYDNCILTKDQKHLLLLITPAFPSNNTGKNSELLQGIDSVTNQLGKQGFENITASAFGAAAVAAGNARQLRKDTLLTQGITVLFLVVFIGLYFRKKRAPFLVLIPVVYGAVFSLACIYFIKGSISVIALGTGSVILGIAVNYSLHVFNHYRHTGNVVTVIKDLSFPLTVGGFTTIGGFLCLEFVKLGLLQDLGLFAAFSLIGAALCSLIFLPHFITSKKDQQAVAHHSHSWIDKLADYKPESNKVLILVILLLTIGFAFTVNRVGFQADMTQMNFMSPELRQAEDRLNAINQFSLRSVYIVTEGKNLDEALKNNEKLAGTIETLKDQHIINKYSGVSSLIISDSLQKARIARWNNYWTPEKKQQLFALLATEGAPLKYSATAFDHFKELLNKEYAVVSPEEMATIRTTFLDDYITEKPGSATVATVVKVSPENKAVVYKAFDNQPSITVIDKQYLTGKLVEIINTDFNQIAWMSSTLVFLVLLLTFGRIELTLVSFIPMLIAWIWILGIMGLLGIQFNIVNIIVSALIFGLGDDYSLFIIEGLLQEYKTGKKNLSSFKSSIILSAITTVAGLGVLIFAKHPALRSIALISIIGILCVVIVAQVLIPFLFRLLITNRVKKQHYPWTLSGFCISIFAFAYFVTGSILLTLLGLFLVKLNPFKKQGKYLYHVLISKFVWSLVYIMGNLTKRIDNPLKEDFSKPAVIVCNHQSFLDILVTVMLHPKLILLTNNWVWKSPVFGAVVRMADYYPVADGAETSIEQMAERVKEGYSIVVFPEGTRTVDGTMKRFHKGAFFIAEKLQLDILPIVIHGTGYNMTKGDFLLKNGTLSVKFLPRITPEDERFGKTYAERAKLIGRYFREQFIIRRRELEQPDYFREKLIYNYIYKGPVLEWYMRIKTRMEKNYRLFHDLLPTKGKILDIGCGYGFLSYMLYFSGPERDVTGIDYDEEKIDVAQRCFSRDENIRFFYSDATAFAFEQYDGIVIADVLHYLQPEQQRLVIEKCIKHLQPGGTFIIRDGNKDLSQRHKGTALTEYFSTKLLHFNKTTGNGLSFLSASLIREITARYNMECTEIDNTKYTSNMMFVIRHAQTIAHEAV
ncbi:MAG: 1-acyl-sn-glycerol-3-phosphate acyltransferase [Chitinophagaceae bacterium]